MRDGEGIESFYNGEKYVGTYREDKQEGQVRKICISGLKNKFSF